MSNRTVLERLLVEIVGYDRNRQDRDAFASRLTESIEALDGVPYSVIEQGRDWRYKIETEGYFDEEGFESQLDKLVAEPKEWVSELIVDYS